MTQEKLQRMLIERDAQIADLQSKLTAHEKQNERWLEWYHLVESAPGEAAEVIRERVVSWWYLRPIIANWRGANEKLTAQFADLERKLAERDAAIVTLSTRINELERELDYLRDQKRWATEHIQKLEGDWSALHDVMWEYRAAITKCLTSAKKWKGIAELESFAIAKAMIPDKGIENMTDGRQAG